MAWNLAILKGGPSPEREISLRSGAAIAAALRTLRHAVTEIELDAAAFDTLRTLQPDCVVLALHGVPGEDGAVQGLLELLGLPYTGSGVVASATAIDKGLTRHIATGLGLSIATGFVVRSNDPDSVEAQMRTRGMTFPVIVKGATAGSTIGLTKVHAADELQSALAEALGVSPSAVIEECVTGIEISVCLLGNEDPQILPTPQILHAHELFNYEAKYSVGQSEHRFPPDCPPEVLEHAEAQARLLYTTLGCAGCGRVDMLITPEGVPVVLEVNTLPGMVEVSLLPDAARQAGISFEALCERLVTLGIERSYTALRLPAASSSAASSAVP